LVRAWKRSRSALALTPEDEARLNEEQRAYLLELRGFQVSVREYEDDRVDHSRNVFIAASILGAAAIVAGLSFFRRIEAMPLGLLLGGFGVVLFGWIQAGDEFDEMGAAPPFIAVTIGLAAVWPQVTSSSTSGAITEPWPQTPPQRLRHDLHVLVPA
jgi:hypothetical protein